MCWISRLDAVLEFLVRVVWVEVLGRGGFCATGWRSAHWAQGSNNYGKSQTLSLLKTGHLGAAHSVVKVIGPFSKREPRWGHFGLLADHRTSPLGRTPHSLLSISGRAFCVVVGKSRELHDTLLCYTF